MAMIDAVMGGGALRDRRSRGSRCGPSVTRAAGPPQSRRPGDADWMAAPARIRGAIEGVIGTRGALPGEVLGHGALAHARHVRRPVVPGRERPPDRVGDALRREVLEHEAGAVAGALVVVADGVDQPARGTHDGQRPVAQAVELVEPAGLEARRHHEEVGAGLDTVRAAFVELEPGPEALRMG